MMNRIRTFFRDRNGATAIEYGLIAALIGVVIITAVGSIGDGLDKQFGTIATEVGAVDVAPGDGK